MKSGSLKLIDVQSCFSFTTSNHKGERDYTYSEMGKMFEMLGINSDFCYFLDQN